jgi:hypothetical protein
VFPAATDSGHAAFQKIPPHFDGKPVQETRAEGLWRIIRKLSGDKPHETVTEYWRQAQRQSG